MPQSEYEKQEQWRKDAHAFLFLFGKYYFWWLGATIGSGAIAILQGLYQINHGGSFIIPGWVLCLTGSSGFVFAAFLAFRDQRRLSEKLEREKAEKTRELETKIMELQSKLEEKSTRKKVKDSIGSCRMTIQNLCAELNDIPYYKYHDEIRQKFERDYLEFENSTYRFLEDKVGHSEAVSFVNDEKIPKVTNIPQSFDMDSWRERWISRKFMLNRLNFRAEQLEKIGEKLDSKDFILPLSAA